jgi:rhodanese-related sulfurtransferase
VVTAALTGPPPGSSGIDEILRTVRARLHRLDPQAAFRAVRHGAVLVDIRPVAQRAEYGEIPGAIAIERNVLEWRLDPDGEHRNPDLARRDRRIILICNEGYQSVLAAATLRRFGLESCDVIDGIQGWMAAGLPLEPTRA